MLRVKRIFSYSSKMKTYVKLQPLLLNLIMPPYESQEINGNSGHKDMPETCNLYVTAVGGINLIVPLWKPQAMASNGLYKSEILNTGKR